METVILAGAAVIGTLLVVGGAWLEMRRDRSTPTIRPITSPAAETPAPSPDRATTPPLARVRVWLAAHPAPFYGWLETALWLVVLVSLVDHLRDPRDSLTAKIAWALTIGPHEIGHVICWPFGWTLHFLGGSIWQVLWWLLLAAYVHIWYRRITGALVFMAVVGHSFINMWPYIADARARELPLLFGMDSSHHDWWNLLGKYDLLAYDQTLGRLAAGTGAVILAGCVLLGLVTTWALPRRAIGPSPRYYGSFIRALRDALRAPPGLNLSRIPTKFQ